eukprot:gene17761-21725_t
MDLLITDTVVVTQDDQRSLLDRAAIAIKGDRIAAVGESAALERDFGDAVITTVGDVGNHADNAHAVERTLGRFGRLDTFIANAAVFDFFQPLVQYE